MKMKHFAFIIASLLVFSGVYAQTKVKVLNNSNFDRTNEIVEVKASKKTLVYIKNSFVLTNSEGKEIAYQLTYNSQKQVNGFIFQADVKAKSKSVYLIATGKPAKVKYLTSAQFVPERKDDFAWENDIAAYRMYGPALASEKPSNGVDLWLKRVPDTVVAKRYRDELKNGLTYHVDRGNGLDCYKVAHTLGAGGIAPFQNGKLFVGDNYNRYVINEIGPLRSVFTLYYDKVKVGNEIVSQEIKVTTLAGSILNKAEVTYSGKVANFDVAGGIFTHDEKGKKYSKPESGIIAYAEDAVSDAKENVGRNYVGVYFPSKATGILSQDNHLLITAPYKTMSTFTYYFGGGWNKWQFPTDEDWFNAMEKFNLQKRQPLKVCIK